MKHPWKSRSGQVAGILLFLIGPATFAQIRPVVKESISPARLTRRSDGIYFIDFGSDAFGQLELKIASPAPNDAGRKITVRLGEKLVDADHLDSKPAGSVRF